jgi:hypothetical protein
VGSDSAAKGEYLGKVEAKDKDAAVKVAMKEFALPSTDEWRLLVRECR